MMLRGGVSAADAGGIGRSGAPSGRQAGGLRGRRAGATAVSALAAAICGLALVCGAQAQVDFEEHASHACIYDSLPVEYETISMSYDDNAQHAPLRITIDASLVTGDTEIVQYVTQVADAAAAWWSRALSTKPATGNVVLGVDSCGSVPVMPLYKGAGVDTDMIMFITAQQEAECATQTTGGALAWAQFCSVDQNYRPVAGYANICPDPLDPTNRNNFERDLLSLIHQFGHALGFSKWLMPFWQGASGPLTENPLVADRLCADGSTVSQPMPGDTVVQTTAYPGADACSETDLQSCQSYVVTPAVAAVAQKFFDCDTIPGLELENQQTGCGHLSSHWESRLVSNELMASISTFSTESTIVSPMTLALFEDTGWYSADYSAATPLTDGTGYGFHEGCSFVEAPCVTNAAQPARGFCRESDLGKSECSVTKRSIAQCGIYEYSSIPRQFAYLSADFFGGSSVHSDYCPTLDIVGRCDDPATASLTGSTGATFGFYSYCHESTVGEGGAFSQRQPSCYKVDCQTTNRYTVSAISSDGSKATATCNFDGQLASFSNVFSGSVICHDPATICGDGLVETPSEQIELPRDTTLPRELVGSLCADGDADTDSYCDGEDLCEGNDDSGDDDLDYVCNELDQCVGFDASGDTDGDGVCDPRDPCPTSNPDDADGDGVCDDGGSCQNNPCPYNTRCVDLDFAAPGKANFQCQPKLVACQEGFRFDAWSQQCVAVRHKDDTTALPKCVNDCGQWYPCQGATLDIAGVCRTLQADGTCGLKAEFCENRCSQCPLHMPCYDYINNECLRPADDNTCESASADVSSACIPSCPATCESDRGCVDPFSLECFPAGADGKCGGNLTACTPAGSADCITESTLARCYDRFPQSPWVCDYQPMSGHSGDFALALDSERDALRDNGYPSCRAGNLFNIFAIDENGVSDPRCMEMCIDMEFYN